jgi:hypothetical protein
MTASIWKLRRACTWTTGICMVFLVAFLQAWATPALDKTQDHIARAIVILQQEHDADSLAAAALLSSSDASAKNGNRAASLMARAALAAPHRADLAWLQAMICQKTPGCDTQPFEAKVRSLDPSNGAGWLGALSRAAAAKDDDATNASLRAISQTDRVDIYYTKLIGTLSPKVAQTGSMSLSEAVTAVIGILAAQGLPAYQSVSNACKGDRLMQANVLNLCQGVARAFENGDTFITEMIGVAIAKRVWSPESPEWKAAADARRLYDYQSEHWVDLAPKTDSAAGMKRYLALCSQYRREQEVFRAELVDAGVSPDPPNP